MALFGFAAGVVAALPLVLVLRGGSRMVAGLAAVIVTFGILSAAIAMVRLLDRTILVPFATCMVLSFLAVVLVAALRHP